MSDDRPLEPAEIAHLEAQAEKERASAARHDAEAGKADAEARELLAEAESSEIKLEREREKRDDELLEDKHFHLYVFDSEVTDSSVATAQKTISTWVRRAEADKKKAEIELQINSPGGSVFAGFAFIDFLTDVQARGHKVTTVAIGMAASMAGVILQVGRPRVMGANCLLLIHEAQFMAFGDYGDVTDHVRMVDIMHDRILTLFADRAQEAGKDGTTVKKLKRRWARKDWWLPAQECFEEWGFCDEIRGGA